MITKIGVNMNIYILIAGIVSLSVVAGHFTVGIKTYLTPMMDAEFDPIAKKVMQCVFHYVSVFLVIATVVLILSGIDKTFSLFDPKSAAFIIGANYALFALIQIIYSLTSGIKNGVFKMFQWTFFIIIAALSMCGV